MGRTDAWDELSLFGIWDELSLGTNRRLGRIVAQPNETYKILRRRIAAKFRMHLIGSLIKLNQISEVLMHGRKKFKQFQPGY